MQNLEGKTAFVTGGASGIGLGIAKALLGAGMNVAIADIRQDHLDAASAELGGGDGAGVPVALRVDAAELDQGLLLGITGGAPAPESQAGHQSQQQEPRDAGREQ